MPPSSSLDVALSALAEFPDIYLFPLKRGTKDQPLVSDNLASGRAAIQRTSKNGARSFRAVTGASLLRSLTLK